MIESLLSAEWLDRLAGYRTLFLGFSGGLDSTVLLYNLAGAPTLKDKLTAVHLHHGLSAHAHAWQAHCQSICEHLSIPLMVRQIDFDRSANIEERARVVRYQVFATLLGDEDCLLLAHHANDQAETLLLQLLRGAGVDGLAAMAPLKSLATGTLARPLLLHPRHALEQYARWYELSWIDDESNQDQAFSRNYLRHQVMPMLAAKWPGVLGNLARAARHCQEARSHLEALATMDAGDIKLDEDTLPVSSLMALSRARLLNVLRVWLKNNQVRLPSAQVLTGLIDEMILVNEDAQPCVTWGDVVIRRYQRTLYLLTEKSNAPLVSQDWHNFPEPLYLKQGGCLRAFPAEQGLQVPSGARLEVRFRQGGERIRWRGQTKVLKKLWQEWRVPPWHRQQIPLIFMEDQLVAVVGLAISDVHYGRHKAYQLELC